MSDFFDNVNDWFAQHHSTRKFVLAFLTFGVGYFVANQTELLAALPAWAVVPIGAFVFAVQNYLKYNTDIPVVGQKSAIIPEKK